MIFEFLNKKTERPTNLKGPEDRKPEAKEPQEKIDKRQQGAKEVMESYELKVEIVKMAEEAISREALQKKIMAKLNLSADQVVISDPVFRKKNEAEEETIKPLLVAGEPTIVTIQPNKDFSVLILISEASEQRETA